MSKERKRLFSYLLALALLLSTVCTGTMTAQAAVLENDGTEITETISNIKVSTNEDRQKVYTLTGDVTNGLTLTLENDETIVLDGNGYQLQATSGNHKGLSVAGDGTLIIEDLEISGGDDAGVDNAACGMEVSENVNVILRGNVTITGGSAHSGSSLGQHGYNGQKGMNFAGKDLIIDSDSQVTISGSNGGTNGGRDGDKSFKGCDGGTGLSFEGDRLLVNPKASLTLTGGNGSNADDGPEVYHMWSDEDYSKRNGRDGGNGGAGMLFNGQLCTIAADATVSATGGTAGKGGTPGYYFNDDFEPVAGSEGKPGSDGTDGSKIKYGSGLVLESVASDLSGITTSHKVTLNFPSEINTASSTYIIEANSTVDTSILPYPEVKNFNIEGWYTNEGYSETASALLNITGDTDLYAKYKLDSYSVTFETNGGSSVASQTVDYNNKATKPADPTKDGYTFAGWFTDEACTNAYDFNTLVISDITLYAKWNLNTYTVSFNTNGGSSVASQTVDYNNKATKPADPTKDGYTFAGWFTDEACTNAYDFNTPVTSDITLYAKWDKNADTGTSNTATYSVSFDTNGGSAIDGQTIAEGGQVAVPAKPSKKNCGFGGWYLDKDCTVSYDFTTPVTKDMTLYAKWYTANFNTSSAVMQKGKSTSVIKAVVLKGDSVKSYKSSNTKVATITKNGKITAKATGKTTITVTTKKGASATLTLKVQKAKVTTKKIAVTNVENNALTLKKGRTFTLETSLTPLTSQDKVTYSSSNKKVATVSKSGKIKAVKKGTAKITVKSGKKKVTITVTVKK